MTLMTSSWVLRTENLIETHNSQVKGLKLTILGLIYITATVSAHDYFSSRLRF